MGKPTAATALASLMLILMVEDRADTTAWMVCALIALSGGGGGAMGSLSAQTFSRPNLTTMSEFANLVHAESGDVA